MSNEDVNKAIEEIYIKIDKEREGSKMNKKELETRVSLLEEELKVITNVDLLEIKNRCDSLGNSLNHYSECLIKLDKKINKYVNKDTDTEYEKIFKKALNSVYGKFSKEFEDYANEDAFQVVKTLVDLNISQDKEIKGLEKVIYNYQNEIKELKSNIETLKHELKISNEIKNL